MRKDCLEQRLTRSRANHVFWSWPDPPHLGTHSSHGCLHRLELVNIPAWIWEGLPSCCKNLYLSSHLLFPSHTWVYRICSSFSKDWLFHVTQFFYWVASISFCIPSVQELWMAYFLSLHVRFLHLYHISWQLLMPQICLTLWTGRFLILCYYFSGYPRRKGKYMIMWE